MKKTFFALTLVSSTVTWGDCGTCSYEQPCCESSCCGCCCEPQPNQCLDTYGYNPSYYDMNCACGISIGVDFLYWYGREQDLEFGYQMLNILELPGASAFDQVINAVLYPDAAWDPGVRVSLGWSSACDGWDLLLEWTYYKNDQKKTFSVPQFIGSIGSSGNFLLSNFWTDSADFYFDTIQSKWELKLNQLDFVLGRRSWISPCFTLRPFGGLRFLWTDVKFKSNNKLDSLPGVNNTSFQSDLHFNLKNDYWGIGFVGGIEPRFYFTPCFSLYSGLSVGLVWGKFDIKRNHILQSSMTVGSTIFPGLDEDYSSKSELYGMQSIFDLELGLRYEMAFCDRRYLGYLETGWEHHALLNHVSRQKYVDSSPIFTAERHDVVFGGFVLRAGFQF